MSNYVLTCVQKNFNKKCESNKLFYKKEILVSQNNCICLKNNKVESIFLTVFWQKFETEFGNWKMRQTNLKTFVKSVTVSINQNSFANYRWKRFGNLVCSANSRCRRQISRWWKAVFLLKFFNLLLRNLRYTFIFITIL